MKSVFQLNDVIIGNSVCALLDSQPIQCEAEMKR